MKLVVILTTLASWSTGQLIYPDQFESMVAATGRPKLQAAPASISNTLPSIGANRFDEFNSVALQQRPDRNFLQKPASSSRANDVISRGILKFALNMDDAVAVTRSRFIPGSRENVIFSPLSVAATLALVLLGSGGRTFEEVSTILGLNDGLDISRNSEAVHRMFGTLISAINSGPGPSTTETSFANGLFVRDGYPIRPEFKAATRNIYNSEIINLDFQTGGGDSQKIVNSWVNDKTRGKIPSILSGPPPPETSVIIASALYFNGEWNQHFIDGSTRRKVFTVAPGETVNVNMMYNGGEFPFFEDKQLRTKILGLPYKGREMTMYVVLPTDQGYDSLRSLERRLDADTLENLIRNMRNETCIIGLPKMKLSSTLSLRDALQSLGLNSLFDPRTADLSLISGGYTGAKLTGSGNDQDANRAMTQRPTTDRISFPNRFGDGDKPKENFFSYDDKVNGYHVEQWSTGFSIGRIARQRRRRSLNPRNWRVQRNAVLKNEEEYLKEEKPSEDKLRRSRRQTIQQINQDFLNEIDTRNQPSYGLDQLRNSIPSMNPGLFADDVLHRVEIDITEKGTEAAAATSVILTKDGSQKRLVADRPFLFFIRHEPTGLILFWGSVTKPTPNYESPTTKR